MTYFLVPFTQLSYDNLHKAMPKTLKFMYQFKNFHRYDVTGNLVSLHPIVSRIDTFITQLSEVRLLHYMQNLLSVNGNRT